MSGDRYIISDQQGVHFLTFTVVDWLDVFTRKNYKDIIVDSLNYCIREKGLLIYSWCLMSNHLHLIAAAKESAKLSDIIRDFKKFTAKSVINLIQNENESRKEWLLRHFEYAGNYDKRIKQYKFWKEDNHALYLHPTETKIIDQKLDYVHNNPVAEGIVERAEEYLYSSARDYAGEKGLVNVTRM